MKATVFALFCAYSMTGCLDSDSGADRTAAPESVSTQAIELNPTSVSGEASTQSTCLERCQDQYDTCLDDALGDPHWSCVCKNFFLVCGRGCGGHGVPQQCL